MEYAGFKLRKEPCGALLDFVMPPSLEDTFFARLYARGQLNDSCDGKPEKIWARLAHEYDGRSLAAPIQVHGINILSDAPSLPERPEADGLFIEAGTERLGSLRFADCTPVVIAGSGDRPWLAMLHSGFKGTLQNIAGTAIDFAVSRGCAASEVCAWIGPAIGFECYSRKRDDPSTEAALSAFDAKNLRFEEDMVYFNLKRQIAEQLLSKGLKYDNIFTYDRCTYCSRDLFYSYRAGDGGNRLFLLAGAKIAPVV